MGQTKRVHIEIQEDFFEKLNQLVRRSPVYVKIKETGVVGTISKIDPVNHVVEVHISQGKENIVCNINEIKPML